MKSKKPDFITEEFYTQALALKQFYANRLDSYILEISTKYEIPFDVARKAVYLGIQKDFDKMVEEKGICTAVWFKAFTDIGDILEEKFDD